MTEYQTSGTQNGESAKEAAANMKDRLRAKAAAAGDAVREGAEQARGWARSQLDGLQNRVESKPYQATAVALGLGVIAGVLLAGLIRGRR